MVVGARWIRSEKLGEHQYRKEYARSLERKRVEWDGAYMGAGETGSSVKCKRSMRLSGS